MIFSTVDRAATEYIGWQEIEYHTSDYREVAYDRVYDWYSHTDITDPFTLAACALEYGPYTPIKYTEMIALREKYFGIPIEYTEMIALKEKCFGGDIL